MVMSMLHFWADLFGYKLVLLLDHPALRAKHRSAALCKQQKTFVMNSATATRQCCPSTPTLCGERITARWPLSPFCHQCQSLSLSLLSPTGCGEGGGSAHRCHKIVSDIEVPEYRQCLQQTYGISTPPPPHGCDHLRHLCQCNVSQYLMKLLWFCTVHCSGPACMWIGTCRQFVWLKNNTLFMSAEFFWNFCLVFEWVKCISHKLHFSTFSCKHFGQQLCCG